MSHPPDSMSSMSITELAALAELQEGLVTRPQARLHLTRKQLEHWLATGRLIVVRWGIYRFAGVPATRWQPLRAALLAAGSDALASHSSAAEVWGMPGVIAYQPELTVPWPMWTRLPGVTSHQSRYLLDHHRAVHQGVPVTSPARTLGDLSGVVGAQFLGRLVDDSLRRHLLLLDDLREVYGVLASRGRRRLTVLRAVLEDRLPGFQPGDSPKELDVRQILVDAGLGEPVLQFQVVVGPTVYLLDCSYPDDRIAIEFNGFDYHRSRSAIDHDAARYAALTALGWRILPVTSSTTARNLVNQVRALRALAPSEV
jgi:very-short-patch-repair endonuclease